MAVALFSGHILLSRGLFASGECEKDVGMGLWQHVNFCFHALILPCLHTFWDASPTSFYIFNAFLSLVSVLFCPVQWSFQEMDTGVCRVDIAIQKDRQHMSG